MIKKPHLLYKKVTKPTVQKKIEFEEIVPTQQFLPVSLFFPNSTRHPKL